MHDLTIPFQQLGFIPAIRFSNHDFLHTDQVLVPGVLAATGGPDSHAHLVTVPRTRNYIPPLITLDSISSLSKPFSPLCRLLRLSCHALIADIWTQLLVDKADQDERVANRPCHLLWDHRIPKPNPLTSLIWLLTCETWPLPAALNNVSSGVDMTLETLFPKTTIVIPASSNRNAAQRVPFPNQSGGLPNMELNSGGIWRPTRDTLNSFLSRKDRELIIDYDNETQTAMTYRPQPMQHTITHLWPSRLGVHELRGHSMWTRGEGYDSPVFHEVGGYMYSEVEHSYDSHRGIQLLRQRLFKAAGIVTYPGIPTSESNIYDVPGGSIRNWSDYGLMFRGFSEEDDLIPWTNDKDDVRVANRKFRYVPRCSPPVWFGWSRFGPDYRKAEVGEKYVRLESACTLWVAEYFKHRTQALRMLFEPDAIPIADLIRDHTEARVEELKSAGRLKAGSNTGESSKTSMMNMIQESAAKFNLFG